MPDTNGKKSKWGLGGILHKDRPVSNADSTYGSEGGSGAPSLTGSDHSQPTSTFVNDQGQVITTTTTTTTTTTSGGGSAQTSGPHTSNFANKLDPRVNSSADQSEVTETVQRREHDRPNIPQKSTMRDRSPNPPPQHLSGPPPIQTDGNYGSPSSPSGRQNFSYPGRAPLNAPAQGQGQQPSTLQNLKTAAVGIHGAGETLRGTFNQAIDKRVGQNPEAMAKNNQVLDGGRQEIESARLGDNNNAHGGMNPKGILRKSGGQGKLRVVNE